jgi:hypothetical protein
VVGAVPETGDHRRSAECSVNYDASMALLRLLVHQVGVKTDPIRYTQW